MLQGSAGRLHAGGEGGELLEFAGGEVVPVFVVSKLGDLGEGEAYVPEDEDHADLGDGVVVVGGGGPLLG